MVGSAFADVRGLRGAVVYAAGPSNSSCTRQSEFDRERARLADALQIPGLFVYVSTTSVEDKPYTHHKREMERLVRERGDYLIARLPIVAGKTTNPHTLLNFLHSRIARSEEFDLYTRARRNVIDVADVAEIVGWLVRQGARNEVVNVAAPQDYAVWDIVRVFQRLTGKHAIFNKIDAGDESNLDVRRIADAPVDFSGDYLERTLARYYR
jgi:dTDP-4-dehydrorhamnose reductase